MKQYQIIYEEKETWGWMGFICMADDAEHAEEQCKDANPDCEILWVSQNDSPEFDWGAMEEKV